MSPLNKPELRYMRVSPHLFSFTRSYFLLTMLLLIVEILIAVFVHDDIIRPYFGDFLVVILLYCFLKSFINLPPVPAATLVLIFSFLIETLQYFRIVDRLGLQDVKILSTLIGNSFEWADLVLYTLGIILVLLIEKLREKL